MLSHQDWIAGGWVDLSTVGPFRLRLYQVIREVDPGLVSLLVEVIAEPSTHSNGGADGWPIR